MKDQSNYSLYYEDLSNLNQSMLTNAPECAKDVIFGKPINKSKAVFIDNVLLED